MPPKSKRPCKRRGAPLPVEEQPDAKKANTAADTVSEADSKTTATPRDTEMKAVTDAIVAGSECLIPDLARITAGYSVPFVTPRIRKDPVVWVCPFKECKGHEDRDAACQPDETNTARGEIHTWTVWTQDGRCFPQFIRAGREWVSCGNQHYGVGIGPLAITSTVTRLIEAHVSSGKQRIHISHYLCMIGSTLPALDLVMPEIDDALARSCGTIRLDPLLFAFNVREMITRQSSH